MLVVGFAAGGLQANCYLIGTGPGGECLVVDPGEGAADGVEAALREHDLRPAAVLATHGHFDHVLSAATIADAHGVRTWIHPADRHLLTDPLAALGPELAAAVGELDMAGPAAVADLEEGRLELAGLTVTVDHTPGHTPGSVVFRLDTDEGGHVALTGDTLFAGSVGRTDLPGGSVHELESSLRTAVLPLDDATVVLPGHGPATTVGRERSANPFLRGLA
ncbi:MBL fold metallo-hydrolase [Amycolatopsis suaedae]|uniref:MBL fold metallo-hydrolase n=1 Tax=Amycolatopsis suaedae TaxID=2510978 RepID=A0A4Q7JCC8_9PSEU|nr:MBL fold metallo-hydrolase [Amycolatopsis suaedae]RZQ65561.1 MBL fold metallo-hydrolase [Amycolatopsis suaedae]